MGKNTASFHTLLIWLSCFTQFALLWSVLTFSIAIQTTMSMPTPAHKYLSPQFFQEIAPPTLLKRVKREKLKYPVEGVNVIEIPYLPETSWANAGYDRPGVYGAGWGTQYKHPVVIEVQGETTEPNYDPTASNYHNPGNWPTWVINARRHAYPPGAQYK